MDNNFDFSVIVCSYNPNIEKLKNTIISIANQKDVKFEIIIADDGSKMNYQNELKSWIDENKISNVKYNFLEENVGTLKNIISAIKVAEGKFIKLISPGDYLFDEYSLKEYLLKFNESDYLILASKAVYYSVDGKIIKTYSPKASGTTKEKRLSKNIYLYMDYLLGASMAYRKEILKYFEELTSSVRLLEDFPVTMLAILNDEKIGFINKPLIWYECDTGSSTTGGGKMIQNDFISFFDYLIEKYKDNRNISKNIKILKNAKQKGKAKRAVYMTLSRPSFLFYFADMLFSTFIRKLKLRKVKIDGLEKIITINKDK